MLTGWMQHIGPTTAAELSQLLAVPENEVDQTLLRLESTGAILRGSFRAATAIDQCEPSTTVPRP